MKLCLALIALFGSISISAPAHALGTLTGTYEVPVQDAALKPFAVYPVSMHANNGDVRRARSITFPLPETLIGGPSAIKMNRVGNTNNWVGDQVSASACTIENEIFSCELQFQNLKVHVDGAREKLLAAKPAMDPVELSKRLDVVSRFSDELHGILIYDLRGYDDTCNATERYSHECDVVLTSYPQY